MIWTEVNNPERSCFMETDAGNGIHYEIIYAQQYVDEKPKGFVLYRIHEDLHQGCIGEIDGKIGLVHGLGMACAVGFHPAVIYQTIDELKILAEKDLFSGAQKNYIGWRKTDVKGLY